MVKGLIIPPEQFGNSMIIAMSSRQLFHVSDFDWNNHLINYTFFPDHINLFTPDNLMKTSQLNRTVVVAISSGWTGRAGVDAMTTAGILTATSGEFSEICGKVERVRRVVIFVDSLVR